MSLTYTKDGQASRWDGDYDELKRLGAGLFPDEMPSSAADALEAMMSAHDAIRPTLENAYDEDWDGAKQDIAMQIWQRYMNTPEMAMARTPSCGSSLPSSGKRCGTLPGSRRWKQGPRPRSRRRSRPGRRRTTCWSPTGGCSQGELPEGSGGAVCEKQKASVEARVQLERISG